MFSYPSSIENASFWYDRENQAEWWITFKIFRDSIMWTVVLEAVIWNFTYIHISYSQKGNMGSIMQKNQP